MMIDNAESMCQTIQIRQCNVVEGEGEEVRITIDVMNEGGDAGSYPFNGMTCADAYLWARFATRPS